MVLNWTNLFIFTVFHFVNGLPSLETRQVTPSLPTGWTSIGCYSDTSSARTLRVAAYTDVTGMTIESCIAFCTPAGYKYAGVEFARECYCDNVIESPGALISDDTCNMTCTGDADEICGGPGGLNIFINSNPTTDPSEPPPASGVIKPSAGVFQYKGCFQDGVNGAPRSLRNQLSIVAGVTAETCTSACKAAGYALAGLEFGQECWCDNYMPLAVNTPDSDCNMVCVADNTELCGAGNRLAVYQDTSLGSVNFQQCLTDSDLHTSDSFPFIMFAVPNSGGDPVQVGTIEVVPQQVGQPTFFTLSTLAEALRESHTFRLSGGSLLPAQWNGEGLPLPIGPTLGQVQKFQAFSTDPPYRGYCAMYNPVSSFGPFIGPPVLGVDQRSDLWSICGTGIVYTNPDSLCQQVVLEMVQPVV
ncbi:WSC domain-containing protein [Psilocybe cubensis]|uniref:WSC domain-containing protein n=2 Tax=Psilocybe cubensis TaxID=181762 RepID=A0ACB8GRJ1_PSICU|nr:WSC domain-containing protein [Psilocybe cubensis]KAH9478079.1 WSC domain-containing protein [Psilocybe cubensis]